MGIEAEGARYGDRFIGERSPTMRSRQQSVDPADLAPFVRQHTVLLTTYR